MQSKGRARPPLNPTTQRAFGSPQWVATGMPAPGVINLVSSDEDGPALLSSHPTRRDGLFIAPSTVKIEQGPLAGTTLQEDGLFTTEALPRGAFVCMYTGTFRSRSEFESLPAGRRDQLARYAVEVDAHDVVVRQVPSRPRADDAK